MGVCLIGPKLSFSNICFLFTELLIHLQGTYREPVVIRMHKIMVSYLKCTLT